MMRLLIFHNLEAAMEKKYREAIEEVKSKPHSVAQLVVLVKSMFGSLVQSSDRLVVYLLYSVFIVD